jgi:formylglycine-generating enzyme
MGSRRRVLGILALLWIMCALPSAVASAQTEPRRFAILVGINQYYDSGLVSLQKAQNDAEDLGKALSRLGGYRSVTVMSGSLPYTDVNFPSKNKIIERVGALAEIVKPEDQVLFFFSGHGVNDASGESYLLPIDAQVKDPTGTGVDLRKDVLSPLESAGVKNIVCLIDACQKTVAKDKGIAIVGINEIKALSRAVVITSTAKGKSSFEDPKGANGLFTRSILAAINGEGDLNRDGYLSVAELERYLPDAVSEYAFNVGMSQKPTVFDSGSGSLQPALLRVGMASTSGAASSPAGADSSQATAVSAATTAKAQFVTFKLPEGLRVDLRILGQDGREIKAWSDTASFSEKLEPGSYRIEAQDRSYLYYPYSATFNVGAAKVSVSLDLKPNFGSLSLSCDPSDGVEVLLNATKQGSLSGRALTIDRLKSGSYELVLSKELYDTKRQTIQIEDGKTTQVKLSLSPNFFTLVVSEKAGMAANLYIDGQNKGALPLTLKLPFRNVSLRVVPNDARYKEWNDSVAPGAKGGSEKRVAALVGRMGSLEVTTDPDADAELTLTPAGGGTALKIGTAPLDYEALIGDYEIGATATVNGKKLIGSAKVSLREGQLSPLRLELKDAAPAVPSGMVLVPGGSFTMGSTDGDSDEKPVHTVAISAFYIGATEVTQAQYVAVMGTNPSNFKGDSLPVEGVSWNDAISYCNKLSEKEGLPKTYTINGTSVTIDSNAKGYRLPTEAEWEFAAKGGASGAAQKVKYAGSDNPDQIAWYNSNSGNTTHPVGQKVPNALAIYDMSGNVWEWCWDRYGNYSSGNQSDPMGASSGDYRVGRGGGWADVASNLRSANRNDLVPGYRNISLGFRVARRP